MTYFNLSGTTNPSYQIGKRGITLNQGDYIPSANPVDATYVEAQSGDLFFNTSSTPATFIFENGQWLEISYWFRNGNTTYINGPVGIGTNSSSGNILTISGNVNIAGNIIYSDGSTQNKAPSEYAAGIAGSIQFNDGENHFDYDSNINWDNSNKRLGVGTTTPLSTIQFKHVGMDAFIQTVSSNSNTTVIDSIDGTTFRSGHYYIQITDTDNNHYQVSQVSVLQNGNIALASEYNLMFDNQIIGTFDADLQGSNLQLLYTPSYSSNVTIKTNRNTMTL